MLHYIHFIIETINLEQNIPKQPKQEKVPEQEKDGEKIGRDLDRSKKFKDIRSERTSQDVFYTKSGCGCSDSKSCNTCWHI